ncbi:hypothetical protein [Nitratifractor sp.]
MYHYLKWAALSLFFKRNLHYIALILVSATGILATNAIYQDLVDYAIAINKKSMILFWLAGKWLLILFFSLLFLYSFFQLGFRTDSSRSRKQKGRGGKAGSKQSGNEPGHELSPKEKYLDQRLEKFRHRGKLRRKSDLMMERMEKKKKP